MNYVFITNFAVNSDDLEGTWASVVFLEEEEQYI